MEKMKDKKMSSDPIYPCEEYDLPSADVMIREDFLFSENFYIEEYANGGDSGSILLATNKANPEDQYLIKHEYYDCACNEYLYSKIARAMNIQTVPVKLFSIKEKGEYFKSYFACAIQYLKDGIPQTWEAIMKDQAQISNFDDYFKYKGLESLFDEGDGIEIIRSGNQL